MNVCILVFEDSSFPADVIISEFKTFMETNTPLTLNLTVVKQPPIPISELACLQNCGRTTPPLPCYFVTPYSISDYTKSLIPNGTQCTILLWDNQGYSVCYGGGTWGSNAGPYQSPFISIPSAWALEPWGPWQYTYSQTFVHEFIHALTTMLAFVGMPVQYSADDCGAMGYDSGCATGYICDPGWAECYKAILNQIDLNGYYQLEHWQSCDTPVLSLVMN